MGTESLYSWGYELTQADLNSDGTVDIEIIVSPSSPEEEGEIISGTYAESSGVVTISFEDDGQTEAFPFQLSTSGDLLVRMAKEDGTDYLITTFLKEADSVTASEIAGTWILSLLELGKGVFPQWAAIDSETAVIELHEDGTGNLYFMQSTLTDPEDAQDESTFHFDWSLSGSKLTIDSANGQALGDDAPVLTIGASKEIMRMIDYEESENDSTLEIEYLIKVDLTIQPEVKHLPLFAPAVDYWGSWYGQKERVYTKEWPWVYFEHLGWMYALEGDGQFAWFNDPALDLYLGTDASVFPYFFGTSAGDVYFFDLERSTPSQRWVYGFQAQGWIWPQ